MDAGRIDELLTRLSLDGKGSVGHGGFSGFPILGVEGATVLARQKTVLAQQPGGRFAPRPGVEFVIVDREGETADRFAGKPCYRGVNQLACDEFARRYGHLFAVSEIEIEQPEDAFLAMLQA